MTFYFEDNPVIIHVSVQNSFIKVDVDMDYLPYS